MIEIITTVAGLSGVTAKDLSDKLETIKERRIDKKLGQRQERRAAFVNQQVINTLVNEYYSPQDPKSGMKRYSLIVNQKQIPTTIYTERRFLALNCPPLRIPMTLSLSHQDKDSVPDIPAAVKEYAPAVLERLETMGVKIWDAPLYRLLDHGGSGELRLLFSETRFLSYRFTTGLLSDELTDALIENEGNTEAVLSDATSALPVRRALLPNVGSLLNFRSRICSGGIGVVLAVARDAPHNDFLIPIQVRSPQVSDGRGLYAVLPKAFHQPIDGSMEEVNIHWTVFRELYEEVFGGSKAERDSAQMKHNWYFNQSPGIEYFRNHKGAFNLEVVAYGINAIAGNYDFGLLLAVRDVWYWKTYGNSMRKMWEIGKTVCLSTKDEEQIANIFTQNEWANESILHLAEGLLRLKEIEPSRVNLPEIERGLGTV